MNDMKKAVIYARYSSRGQNEQSIDQQIAECEKFAKRNGYTIINRYYDEARTGTNDKRPNFQRMIFDSGSKNFEYIIIYKMDRFARNRYHSVYYKSKLKKNGVKVISAMEPISDDPSGIILESLLETMAEHYSTNLSQNVKRGLDANAEQCLCTGGNRTLGYKVIDKKYVINPETAPVIKTIFEMYIKGYTPPQILDYLNQNHIKSITGKEFKKNNLYYILSNKRYAGYYTYKDTEKKGGIPAIISEEIFNKAQSIMAKNKKAPARTKAIEEKYLLSSITKCGYCGRNVTGICGTSKSGGKKHFYYRCSSHSKKTNCTLKSFRKKELEDLVVSKTLELLTPKRINRIASEIVQLCNAERENKSGLKALENKLKKIGTEKQNLLNALKAGMAQQIILEELENLSQQQKDIELAIAKESTKYPILTVETVRKFMNDFISGDVKDFYFREKLIETFVNKIEIYNDKITISYNVQDGYSMDYSICFSSDLAGAEGLEPSPRGFGDRCSTN